MRVEESRIDRALFAFAQRLVVAPGIIEGLAKVNVNNWRKRIQLNRAFAFGNSFFKSS